MSEITKASVQSGIKAGKPIIQKLDRITKDPMRTQMELLKKLLEDNKDTEYGKKYELVITNLSGFYRYRMKDVFLITGKYNNNPTKEAPRDSLEANLAKVNPSMGNKVKKGLCKPTEVLFLQPETYLLYRSRERFCDLSLLFFFIE